MRKTKGSRLWKINTFLVFTLLIGCTGKTIEGDLYGVWEVIELVDSGKEVSLHTKKLGIDKNSIMFPELYYLNYLDQGKYDVIIDKNLILRVSKLKEGYFNGDWIIKRFRDDKYEYLILQKEDIKIVSRMSVLLYSPF